MIRTVVVAVALLSAIAQDPPSHLVIPLTIEAVPGRSFGRGKPVILKATFATDTVGKLSGVCQGQGFAIRLYDAATVAVDPPRASADSQDPKGKPVTPYLQQTGVEFDPLTGPDDLRVAKQFPPFTLPALKGHFIPKRIYAALFRTCDAIAKPVDIDQTQGTVIYNDAMSGQYLGGKFFKTDCVTVPGQCWYRPE